MIKRFKDIESEDLYEEVCVMFICGDKTLFNNIVGDKCAKLCTNSSSELSSELKNEFGWSSNEDEETKESKKNINRVEIEQFMDVCYTPSLAGRWYCRVQMQELNEKAITWIKKYIKSPSSNALLVIEGTEYKQYKSWLTNKQLEYSRKANLIQLSFPTRKELISIITNMFSLRHVIVDKGAVELFMYRMGGRYDIYDQTIDEIVAKGKDKKEHKVENWNESIMKERLGKIQHYSIDMVVSELLKERHSKKPSAQVKVIKILKYLIDEHGSKEVLNKVKYEVADLIKFRLWINEGKIPVNFRYPVEEVKNRLDKNMNVISFRIKANEASKFDLKDLVFISTIISTLNRQPERCLYIIAMRYSLNQDRLLNALGIQNTLNLFDWSD